MKCAIFRTRIRNWTPKGGPPSHWQPLDHESDIPAEDKTPTGQKRPYARRRRERNRGRVNETPVCTSRPEACANHASAPQRPVRLDPGKRQSPAWRDRPLRTPAPWCLTIAVPRENKSTSFPMRARTHCRLPGHRRSREGARSDAPETTRDQSDQRGPGPRAVPVFFGSSAAG